MQKGKWKGVSEKINPRNYTVEVDFKALGMLAITIVMCGIFILTAFLFVRGFFGVKNFDIKGVTTYDSVDIVNAAGVKKGEKLYSVDLEAVELRILDNCPYLESATVTRKFPNTICFTLEEKSPSWYIDIAGDYYVLDSDLNVMTETASRDKMITAGATEICLPNLKSAMRGDVPEFGKDEQEIKKTLEIVSIVRQNTFKARITKLDLSSRFEIYLTVDGVYEVYMGDTTNFEAKLEAVKKIVDTEQIKQYSGGEINASDPASVYFKPKYEQKTESE